MRLLGRAAAKSPHVPEFHNSLGIVLADLGRLDESLAAIDHALRLRPRFPEALSNRALALRRAGRLTEAVGAYRQVIGLNPRLSQAHDDLGNVLRTLGRLSEAEAEHREAIRLDPSCAAAHNHLAATLTDQGRAEEATACDRIAHQLLPESAAVHSRLLYGLHFSANHSAEFILEAHLDWARRHGEPLYSGAARDQPVVRPQNSDPHRRLRVGYVSPDFRQHPVATFFEPVLANRDPAGFEVFCYSDVVRPDAVTERLRGYGAVWRDMCGEPDARVAELIRSDRIDILVDLTGHMNGNRLPLFARKPAPVQVAYIGYPDTTGLATMDYKITDALHDPPGMTERYYTEKLVRLPECCWCYRPDDDAPAVNELPALASGHITFGVLNQLVKATPLVMKLWARVLEAVPGSRLMALVKGGAEQDPAVRRHFADGGIPLSRLVLVGRRPRRQYLELYHQVDVALDTFPFNGHTTTLEALWMGLPTVTLAGVTHCQRAGLSVLSAVGLAEGLVATTPEQYVELAVRLASDLPKLAEMRSGLRERMRRSPLCDGPRVARALEGAYRAMRDAAAGGCR